MLAGCGGLCWQALKRMEPTIGLEPMTCRLRNFCGESLQTNPICFQFHWQMQKMRMHLILWKWDSNRTATRKISNGVTSEQL